MRWTLILNLLFLTLTSGVFAQDEPGAAQPRLRKLVPKGASVAEPTAKQRRQSKDQAVASTSAINVPAAADARTVKIDEQLQISFPKPGVEQSKTYLFKPYPQKFISRAVKLLHVVMTEVRPTLMSLNFPGSEDTRFQKSLNILLAATHFIKLLEFHPVFQIRKASLEPVDDLKMSYENDLLRLISIQPEARLKSLRDILLTYPFEDVYALHDLYSRIRTFVQPAQIATSEDYDWFGQRAEEWLEPDFHHTYLTWLDQNPEYILQNLLEMWQKLIIENIEESLPYVSRTYLRYNRELMQILKLLEPQETVYKKLDVALEFNSLHFEPYGNNREVYEQLARLYPQFPGSQDFHKDDVTRSKLFFPFFDQIMNHAIELEERGQFACVKALPPDVDICRSLWGNATELFRFIVVNAPYRIMTKRALEALERMRTSNKSGLEFMGRPELMKLMDLQSKPWL